MQAKRKKTFLGFTLVEGLLASVILAMAIMAILMPFTAGAECERADARSTVAVALAQEMMEEILSKPFDNPEGNHVPEGPDAGETRATYDGMQDYDGYTESDGHISNVRGEYVTDPAAAGLTRATTAKYVWMSGQDVNKKATFIRVTVTVSHKGKPLVSLTRLVYAMHDQT